MLRMYLAFTPGCFGAQSMATRMGRVLWRGTRADGSAIDVRSVTVVGVRAGRIARGRFYLEEAGGGGGGMHFEGAG
jgi:hypothetical protein